MKPGQRINLIGQRFDKLLVTAFIEVTPSGCIWLCQCDCGTFVRKMTTQLRRKNRIRGGCYKCESQCRSDSSSLNKNGNCKGGKTRIYSIWKGMRRRCSNIKFHEWHRYGGRRIELCEQWQDFHIFREWALSHGYADNLTIDRIDNDGNYEPSNCRFITRSENTKRRYQLK